MKQLLVPTDFSPCAENAISFAIQSARILPVEVVLLHAFELHGNLYTDYMGVNKEFHQSQVDDAYNRLMKTKMDILEREGVEVETVFFRGTLNDGIKETVEKTKTDLIIMGTTGASGIEERIWGSKTAGVIGFSKTPVLAIPRNYSWKKPERILISTNHFEKEPRILDFIFELAGLYMAEVHVGVFSDEDDDMPETILHNQRQAVEYEIFLKKTYTEETLTATNVFGKEFEDTLEEFIASKNIDMLVMITYKRSFWDRIFHPSITKRMSYHTHIPLLSIPVK